MTATILVVDDEQPLLEFVSNYLIREGYQVVVAADGRRALELIRTEQPDVVILDVMLPGLDGIEVCRQLRTFSDAYVLMLTARTEEVDKLIGLQVGADDYVTKPFSPRELVARVQALLRRSRTTPPEDDGVRVQALGELAINRAEWSVKLRGEELALTQREFQLLATLAEHPGRVFTRQELLDRAWGSRAYDDHIIEVYIANLRHKIEDDPGTPRYLQTVRGVGYRIARDGDAS
jgi:two-component system, OmpR family, alkaline phosphatase synthesis response regulator PhoP